jgi:hypothetical protein
VPISRAPSRAPQRQRFFLSCPCVPAAAIVVLACVGLAGCGQHDSKDAQARAQVGDAQGTPSLLGTPAMRLTDAATAIPSATAPPQTLPSRTQHAQADAVPADVPASNALAPPVIHMAE